MRNALSFYGALLLTTFSAAALVHCGGDDSSPANGDDAGGDATPNDSGRHDAAIDAAPSDAGAKSDAALTPFCQAALHTQTVCFDYDGSCGDAGDYATLCDAFDDQVNSAQYRQAVVDCTTGDDAGCSTFDTRDCEYRRYADASTAQAKLATDYCSTCEPANGGCTGGALAYDGGATSPVFNLAWEVGDSLVTQIDSSCTGAALTLDAGSCAESFRECGAGVLFASPALGPFLKCE